MVVATDVKDVSLMVHLPDCARSNSDLLEFYSDLHGAWQTLPSLWRDARTEDLDTVIKALDGKLQVLMKEVVGKKGANWGTFKEIGLTLYHDVVPDDVRKELRDAAGNPGSGHAPILRIHLPIKLARIPWEIMYDDDIGFLGVCFQIARLPITPHVPDLSDTTPHAVHKIYNLLGRDIVEDNEFSFDTWQRTFTDVIPGFKHIQYPPHQQATDGEWPTINQITVAADILHITCHGGLEDGFGEYWTLSDSEHETTSHQIRDSTIRLNQKNLREFRTLVFGNACARVASEQNSVNTLTPGFGPDFYVNGAAAFVGTCAPITKRVALEFPRKFYEFLLEKELPIGEALLETKRYFYQQKDNDPTWNDPSWLFYCLYGSPETCFRISS